LPFRNKMVKMNNSTDLTETLVHCIEDP
jgi:hypothetical protein